MHDQNVWNIVYEERRALIADLEGIDSEQWATPSLCDDWTVHDVLAHLLNDAKSTKVSFVRELILARFNFDRLNQNGVDKEQKSDPQDTLAAFRQVSHRTTSAPAPLASRLVEAIVHGEDIRRPLQIDHVYPSEAILAAIEYQLATSDAMGGSKDKAAGLCLITNDAEWTHGAGAEVHGNALDILLALTGRTIAAEALSGEGANQLLK